MRTQKYVFHSTECGFTGGQFKAAPTRFGSLTLGRSPVPPELCELCPNTPRPALAAQHSLCSSDNKHSAVSEPTRPLIPKPQGADPLARDGEQLPGPRGFTAPALLLSLLPGSILVPGRLRTARPACARPLRRTQRHRCSAVRAGREGRPCSDLAAPLDVPAERGGMRGRGAQRANAAPCAEKAHPEKTPSPRAGGWDFG